MLQRRSLPIAAPCPLANDVLPVADGIGWCEQCRLHVHDLSAGTELEARALLRAHGRSRLCVSYGTRADGTIVFRERARSVAIAATIALLVACTGHAPIDVAPEQVCRDADGRERLCPAPVEPALPVRPAVVEPPRPAPPAPREAAYGGEVIGILAPPDDPIVGALSYDGDDEDVWAGLAAEPAAAKRAKSRRARRSAR